MGDFNWERFLAKLLELDYRKPVIDRNPWIGRLSLYDLIDAAEYATNEKSYNEKAQTPKPE